jgi:hypothetical protein
MSTLSKSSVRVARAALAVAEATLADYGHRFSPHRFTQPQLFACLALKTFFKTDYRGITELLQVPNAKLKNLAVKHKPPQSWFDERNKPF